MTGHNAQEKATRLVSGTHAAPSLERVGERDAGPSNSTERPVTLDRGLWALDRPPVSGGTANTRTARYAVSWIQTIT